MPIGPRPGKRVALRLDRFEAEALKDVAERFGGNVSAAIRAALQIRYNLTGRAECLREDARLREDWKLHDVGIEPPSAGDSPKKED